MTVARTALALISLALASLPPAHALSPPDLDENVSWKIDPGGSGPIGTGRIEAAFDAARRAEERQLGLPRGSLGELTLPSEEDWATLGVAARALAIVNAERIARAGVPYPDGAPLGLPLDGVERHLDALAQDYADYMLANDFWGHEAPPDGPSPFAGTDPFERIDAAAVIGEGRGTDGGDCHAFLGQAENLAIYAVSAGEVRAPIARAVYDFLYADAGSDWGHRRLLLLQDEPLDGGPGGFDDDAGTVGREGFIGVGTAGATDGGYPVFEDTGTFPVQRNVVVLLIDPVPDEGCAYDVAG